MAGLRMLLRPGRPATPRDDAGNVTIEAAFVLPILVALLLGLIDFGFAVQARMALEGAARSGAQAALLTPGDLGAVEAAVRLAAEDPWLAIGGDDVASLETSVVSYCECGGVVASCEASCGSGDLVKLVMVSVSRPYSTLVPYPGIGERMTLRGRAVFRLP